MTDSGILTVHLRHHVDEVELRAALAALLRIDLADIAPLETASPALLVPYQYTARTRGFRSTIEVYAGRLPDSDDNTDLRLAKSLAKRFAQDALITPPSGGDDPYRWLLVRPDGTSTEVAEVPPDEDEEDDGVVIREPVGP